MIEYILALVVLAAAILLLSGLGKPRKRGPRTSTSYSDDYHGVYSHSSKSPDAEVHFPVRKDSTSVFPMNKRKERKKTETHQPRR
ncbi:MAG: hypothetical protein KAR03_08245 [Candidatus Thorarchaeota archaeon]|nr:hypothetical protein [Candidatus Thorarchaeota archaeon]